MKKVLVTGGAGFIGSSLVDELLKKNYEVVCIDNCSAKNNENFYWNDNATNFYIDICKYDSLLEVLKEEAPTVVFHLAAEARIQPSIKDPRKTCHTNFIGTCNVLQASRESGVQRVVYSSTSSVYGTNNTPPYKETSPRDCRTPYAVSKAAGEDLCGVYFELYGLETVTFRYFNVYGDRQPLKGEYAPVIGLFIRQRKSGQSMTIIGDGSQTRDFTHIDDVVQANIAASEPLPPTAFGEVFNIGSGRSYSILELTKEIGGNVSHLPKRLGEADVSLADISKAKEILGWEPRETLEKYLSNIDFGEQK